MLEEKKRSASKAGIDPELSAREARARFLQTCLAYQPLGVVRRKPLLMTSGAFLAGFGLMRLFRPAASLALLPAALQLAQLTAKVIMGFQKK